MPITIPVINYPDFRPYTNIVPFTIRDGATYLLQLEALKEWIRDTLVPHVDTNIQALADAWGTNVTELQEIFDQVTSSLISQVETAIAELTTLVNDSVASMGNSVEEAQAARDAAITARNEAEAFADTAEGAVDASVTLVLNNPESDAREALDVLYATQASLNLVADILNGRLSETTLADTFADKASTAASLNLKASASALADEVDARIDGDAAANGRIDENVTDIAENASAISRLASFFRSPRFTPIKSRKTPDTTLATAGTMPENVIKVDSTYWLLYTSITTGTKTALSLAYSSSPRGPWTPYNGGTPVLTSGSLEWETDDYTNGGCLLEHEGTFYIFYSSDTIVDSDLGGIGVASASSVTGPYVKQTAQMVERGAPGAWDSRRVQEPSVIVMPDGTWLMAYMGETLAAAKGESEKIGFATAADPFGPWTKAASNPLIGFGSAGTFDVGGAADPSLWYEDGVYWCLYSGLNTAGAKPWQIGLAYATNPVAGPWTRHPSGAVIKVGAVGEADSKGVWRGAIYEEDGIHHVTYGAIPDSGASAAAVAKYAELSMEAVNVWRSDVGNRDTGWIQVVKPGDVATMPTLSVKLRRVGNVVGVQALESAASNSPGVKTLYTLPEGFRNEAWSTAPCVTNAAALIANSLLAITPTQIILTAGANSRHFAGLTYITRDNWPVGY